jgi:hypothetical protein
MEVYYRMKRKLERFVKSISSRPEFMASVGKKRKISPEIAYLEL